MKATQLVLLAVCASFTFPAMAQKVYTPKQLRAMVDAGRYPKQGSPKTQTESVDFKVCVAKVREITASVRPNYPAKSIVSTGILVTEKIWTNDAAMTLSCSAPDRSLVITTAPYL